MSLIDQLQTNYSGHARNCWLHVMAGGILQESDVLYLTESIESLENTVSELQKLMAEWQKHQDYRYISKSGTPILAKVLEDENEELHKQISSLKKENYDLRCWLESIGT